MGLKKYRFNIAEPTDTYGVTVLRAGLMGNTPVAGIRNCFCGDYGRRTVYVTGKAESYITIAAAIRVKGRRINGWVACVDGRWEFHRGPVVPFSLSKTSPLL